jgi:hypothetical protein
VSAVVCSWVVLFVCKCGDPGMFVIEDDDRTLWFRHDSFEGGIQFELIGSVCVLCWREGYW